MAEDTERKACNIASMEYPVGTIVCRSGKCETCSDGVWEETGDLCPCWNQELV